MLNMQELIDKYLDGATSNAEEEQLRTFFTSPESIIPEELEWMKALFGYREEIRGERIRSEKVSGEKVGKERIRRPELLGRIAAVILVLLVPTLLFLRSSERRNFAMIDGKRITNMEIVHDEALEALNMVSATDEETFDALFQ